MAIYFLFHLCFCLAGASAMQMRKQIYRTHKHTRSLGTCERDNLKKYCLLARRHYQMNSFLEHVAKLNYKWYIFTVYVVF